MLMQLRLRVSIIALDHFLARPLERIRLLRNEHNIILGNKA